MTSDIEHQTPFLAMHGQEEQRKIVNDNTHNHNTSPLTRAGKVACLLALSLVTFYGCFAIITPSSFRGSHGNLIEVTKKFNPGKWNPKPMHHGRVNYSFRDEPGQGRIYTRKFTAPCAYGILVFQIGMAKNFEPFEFDIFHDEYVYEDNSGLCALFPSYHGTQTGTRPFWSENDATEIIVNFEEMNRISTLVPDNGPEQKKATDSMSKRLGDYVIIGKGNFYSTDFYKELKNRVNRWKAEDEESLEDILADLLNKI